MTASRARIYRAVGDPLEDSIHPQSCLARTCAAGQIDCRQSIWILFSRSQMDPPFDYYAFAQH